MHDPAFFNELGKNHFPGHVGLTITEISNGKVKAEMPVRQFLMAPNGFLHAGALVTFADSCAGYGCVQGLPPQATGFTTVETKSNHLGTAQDGMLLCEASLAHSGRSTQVWDATVTHRETGKVLVLFRCTQMILYPKPN